MEFLKTQNTYDAALIIRQFLEATSHNEVGRPDERSLTARLCAENLELFREIIKTRSSCGKSKFDISLERSFSRLKLWSDGYGISRGDLDDIFERSRKVRIAALKLLGSIGTSLTDRLVPKLTDGSVETVPEPFSHLVLEVKTLVQMIGEDDDSESSASDDSSDFGDDSIQEIVEDLQTDTMCLMELDPLIKSPVLDVVRDKEKSAPHTHVIEWAPHKAYCDKVESRFPQADDSLISRLGKANYERYVRCQEERDRQEHEALADDDNNALLFLVRAGTIDGSKFHDSGLGSSIPAASSYAETIMSYGGGDGRSVRVPPLPLEGKAGKPFACVACGRSVLISNNSAWKQHLYADLSPWLCLDSSCPYGDKLFNNRNDWVSHLALDHGLDPGWGSFKCPLCHNDTGVGKLAITKHLGGHLEEISLGALPSGLDFESESDGESQDDEDIHADVSTEIEHNTTLDNTAVSANENAQDTTDSPFHITEVADEEPYTIKCVCDFSEDDGNTIYCENCDTWQHIECYYPRDNKDVYNDNFEHSCIDCKPRPIDRQRAIELQKGRLREIDEDTNLESRPPRTPFNSVQSNMKARAAKTTNSSANNEPTSIRSLTTSHSEHSPEMPLSSADNQPTLNNALEYLDRVKIIYADQPDIYNRFIDIMKDFKSRVIDTPGVINRIIELFNGHPSLFDGFNTFLPPGYAIVCNEDNGKNIIRVSTPTGTVIQKPSGKSALVDETSDNEHATIPLTSGEANNVTPLVVRPDANGIQWITFDHSRDRVKMEYTIRTDIKLVNVETLSPEFKTENCVFANAYYNQEEGRGSHQSEYNAIGWALAELNPVLRGKRGLIQKAVNCWVNSPKSRSTVPVEFNQSISYVNKDRFLSQPEKYNEFFEILQTYQRESTPIQSVYAQVVTLFADAPELLEDFKQFLPESAAEAEAKKTEPKAAE